MRTNNIKIQLTIPYPINIPDGNGTIYSKESIENAIGKMREGIPIMFRSNDSDDDGIVIGGTTENAKIIGFSEDGSVCNVLVNGVIYAGGSDCIAEKDNGVIKDFSVMAFGLSDK